MNDLARPLLACVLGSTLALSFGCGAAKTGDAKTGDAKTVEAKTVEAKTGSPLPKATNGAPISAEFVDFIGEGERRGMRVRLYNHGDLPTAGVTLLFRYYDANDELLRIKVGTTLENDNDFASVVGSAFSCEPKRDAIIEVSRKIVDVPSETVRVEVLPSKVLKLDAEGKLIEAWWTQDNFTEWPGDPKFVPGTESPAPELGPL